VIEHQVLTYYQNMFPRLLKYTCANFLSAHTVKAVQNDETYLPRITGETSSKFHQHFMSSFCANILLPKKLQSQTVVRGKLQKALLYKKCTCKILMTLTVDTWFRYHKTFRRILLSCAFLYKFCFFNGAQSLLFQCFTLLTSMS